MEPPVRFSKWNPYTPDWQFKIPYDSVMTINTLSGLQNAYENKIKEKKEVEAVNPSIMTEQVNAPLRTNHNIRIVNLATGDNVLCIFGEVRNEDDNNRVVGYRMLYPYKLELGTENQDGTIPIQYSRWCPFPQEEHRLSGEHIISVVFPDNGILDNFANRVERTWFDQMKTFSPEEATDGTESEPAMAQRMNGSLLR